MSEAISPSSQNKKSHHPNILLITGYINYPIILILVSPNILLPKDSIIKFISGLPWWYRGYESGVHGFNPWYSKIPCAEERPSLRATATEHVREPTCPKSAPQKLHSEARGAAAIEAERCNEDSPRSPQPEKAQAPQRPSTIKNRQIKSIMKYLFPTNIHV